MYIRAYVALLAASAARADHREGEKTTVRPSAASGGPLVCEEESAPGADDSAVSLVQLRARIAARDRDLPADFGLRWNETASPEEFFDNRPSLMYVEGNRTAVPFVGCFPYKNGMTWWVNFACEIDARCSLKKDSMWRVSDQPKLINAMPSIVKRRTNEQIWQLFTDTTVRHIMLKRNPVVRALSAWLTWVGTGNMGNVVPDTFGDFVTWLEESEQATEFSFRRSWSKNGHWIPQTEFCHARQGTAQYEEYKVEERAVWGPTLFASLGPEAVAAAQRLNFTEHKADQDNAEADCTGYGCHAKAVLAQHYTLGLFDRVRRHYAYDIAALGYAEDVASLRERLMVDLAAATAGAESPLGLLQLQASQWSAADQAKILDAADGLEGV